MDSDHLSHHKRFSHHLSGFGQHPTKGLSGNVHSGCCGFLVQLFKIAQTQGLKTLQRKNHLF
jgi:hypothetical protein